MDQSKRRFIKQSFGLIAASGLVAGGAKHAEAVGPPDVPASMKAPGAGLGEYGSPAKYERKVTRALIRSQPGTTGSGASRTPLESLDGMITPAGCTSSGTTAACPTSTPTSIASSSTAW